MAAAAPLRHSGRGLGYRNSGSDRPRILRSVAGLPGPEIVVPHLYDGHLCAARAHGHSGVVTGAKPESRRSERTDLAAIDPDGRVDVGSLLSGGLFHLRHA